MYTVKGLLDTAGQSAILETAKDWKDALEIAEHLRKQGRGVQIYDANGVKVANWNDVLGRT